MKKCKITVMRISRYEDLMAQFENPIDHACRRYCNLRVSFFHLLTLELKVRFTG